MDPQAPDRADSGGTNGSINSPPENSLSANSHPHEAAPERISLLKVPLDIIPPEELNDVIYRLLSGGEGKNIVLLSVWDLLRARGNNDYRSYVLNASLVIPISKSLIRGAKFLTGKTPYRYMPFNFVVNLLTTLEKREYSAYLLGAKSRILKVTEKNIRQTFPQLRIVGRFVGRFRRQDEKIILEAIRKASPSLLLVGKGIHGEEVWIGRNSAGLNPGLRLWCSDLFEVFAEKKKRPSTAVFERGFEWIGFCFQNPLRIFRIFPFFHYNFLLLFYRIFKKSGKSK